MDNTAEPFRPSSSASSQLSFDRPSSRMSGHFNPGSNLSIHAPSNAGAGASASGRSNGLPSPSSDLRHLDPSPQQYNQPLSPSYSNQQYQYQQREQYQPHQQQGGEQRPSLSTSGEIAGGDHRAEHSSQQSSGLERERAQPSYHPDHYPGRQNDRYDDRADQQQQQHRQSSPHPPHALHIEPPSPRSSFPSALSSAPSPAPSSATTQSSNFSVQTNPFETAPPPSSLSSGYPPASKPFSPPSNQSSLPSAAQSAFHSVHSVHSIQQQQHHQQQQQQRPSSTGPQLPEQVPFTPQPGFPAVPTLGGYPTGHGNDSASGSAGQLRAPAQTPLGGEKRSIWLGDLETWMNEAYLRQMCSLMGWDIVSIKLIRPNPPPAGSNAPQNNPYCFLTFPTHHLASRILHTLTPTPTNPPIFMPSSSRPFKANWAASSTSSSNPEAVNPAFLSQDLPPEKEFSIFVGDLAPEVGEGDLVNLFLRPPPTSNGVERKGYESTRSAKIMLDAGGGGSRGYGFVRFGEEADQLRALAEMQGVYCLSRPMRLSHATAKNKAGMASHSAGGSSIGNSSSRGGTPLNAQFGGGQHHPHDIARSISPLFPVVNPNTGLQNSRPLSYGSSQQQPQQQSTKAIPPPTRRLSPNTIEYLSELAAANGGTLPFGPGGQIAFPPLEVKVGEQEQSSYRSSGGNVPSSLHIPSSNYNSSRSLTHDINPSPRDQQYGSYGQSPLSAVSSFPNSASPYPSSYQDLHNSLSPTSLGHPSLYDPHASSMSGSGSGSGSRGGGGGVNSTDPNNTTVFVGGLSSLISEDTLKTFFTPFGEITYVKIPPGKGCGFVQFVRKVDAERAIERMQGFPIGGGRIRLSWGRSQYKAAQAAAQAAQLGVGIGALTNTIPGLSATQIGQLALALQGLSGGNLLSQLTGGQGMSNGLGGGAGSHGDGLGGLDTQNLQALLGLGGGGISGGGANGGATLDPALISRLTAQAGLSGFPSDVSPPQQHSQQQQQQQQQQQHQQQSQHQHRDVPSAPDPHRSYSQPSLPTSAGLFNNNVSLNGPSTFAPFSPAQSPDSKTSNNNLPRHSSSLLDRRHTQVDFGGLRGNGGFGSFGGGSGSYGADEDDEEDERSNAFDTLQIHRQLPRRGSQQLQHSHSSSFGAIERDSYLASVYAEGGPKTSPLHIGRSIPGSFSSYPQPPPSHLRGSFEADDDLNNNNSYLSSSRSPPRILESGSQASRHAPQSNSNSYLSSSYQEKYLQHHTPPALQQTSSYSSDISNSNSGSYNARFLGTGGGGGGSFEPPATAPMMQNSQTDYLQQQQSQGLPSSSGRARAASASIHRSPAAAGGPPGVLDLAMEMEGLDVNGNDRYNPSSSPVDETYDRMPMSAVEPRGGSFGGSYGLPGGGERRSVGGMGGGGGERASGRSFGFGSFGGVLPSSAGLRSNFPNSRLGSGGRLGDE